jgi:hypothetical protein
VAALLVTPPDREECVKLWESADRSATAVAKPTSDGIAIELDGRPDTRYLILRGSRATAVTANGAALPRLEADQIASSPPGWCARGCDTIVRLPHGLRRAIAVTL